MSREPEILRYTAFTDTPAGGNPAGVVLDASELTEDQMLAIAAELGYSESAFVTSPADGDYDLRYFSPQAEVPFCGHATIATGVALAEREGAALRRFHTKEGIVPVDTSGSNGSITAALTSVPPRVETVPPDLFETALFALGWDPTELDRALPPRIGYAGVRHLILAAKTRERLATLDYDFEMLKATMLAHDLTTVNL